LRGAALRVGLFVIGCCFPESLSILRKTRTESLYEIWLAPRSFQATRLESGYDILFLVTARSLIRRHLDFFGSQRCQREAVVHNVLCIFQQLFLVEGLTSQFAQFGFSSPL
jgi:hypothetical protein